MLHCKYNHFPSIVFLLTSTTILAKLNKAEKTICPMQLKTSKTFGQMVESTQETRKSTQENSSSTQETAAFKLTIRLPEHPLKRRKRINNKFSMSIIYKTKAQAISLSLIISCIKWEMYLATIHSAG